MNGLAGSRPGGPGCGAVEVRTYVPGYPITDLAAALEAEISVNEKVALEIALGASATGSRSLVVVKQVGMNILADPLVISATHTIGSGLVVIAGDDLGPRGSQAEMDSRFYGPLAEIAGARSQQPGRFACFYSGGLYPLRVAENSGYRPGDSTPSGRRGTGDPAAAQQGCSPAVREGGLGFDHARAASEAS